MAECRLRCVSSKVKPGQQVTPPPSEDVTVLSRRTNLSTSNRITKLIPSVHRCHPGSMTVGGFLAPWKQHTHHLEQLNMGEGVFAALLTTSIRSWMRIWMTWSLNREEESLEAARPLPSRKDAIIPNHSSKQLHVNERKRGVFYI